MICKTCANAADQKKGPSEHCNRGQLTHGCDCQHRVPEKKS